jgi:DNA modification methylase
MAEKENATSELDKLINRINKYEWRLRKLYSDLAEKQRESFPGKVYSQETANNWAMYHGDCVEAIKGLPDQSIHYSIFSPPFLSLYVYSDMLEDMGNSKNDDEFYDHFSYLIPELLRVLKPGRLVSVHCSLIPMTIQHEGIIGLKDLPGQISRLFQKYGFIYHSKVNIWKDPLIQATRTKMLTLAHKQISKDSTRCSQGFAEEILTFRKPGENPEPVAHGRGFEQYIGEQEEPKYQKQDDPKINKYSHHVWQRYASPVWWDINQSDTLNFRAAREDKDERHICPLQLPVIARCLELWTNKGDVVLSPFAGIASEGWESIRMSRKFIGIELKEAYYKTGIKNLKTISKRGQRGFNL